MVAKPENKIGAGLLRVKLSQMNQDDNFGDVKFDVVAYYKSINEIKQGGKIKN